MYCHVVLSNQNLICNCESANVFIILIVLTILKPADNYFRITASHLYTGSVFPVTSQCSNNPTL